jgi:hypothetical protein
MVWTPRDIGRVIAGVVFCFGCLCLPLGFGANPKRDTSLFENFADLGLWFRIALVMIPLGIIIALFSFFLPSDD